MQPRIALGEAVILTLYAPPGMLQGLDLSALAADFEVQGRTLKIVNPLYKKLIWGGFGTLSLIALAVLARLAYRALRWRFARAGDMLDLVNAVRTFSPAGNIGEAHPADLGSQTLRILANARPAA
jgi:hypothetical protein